MAVDRTDLAFSTPSIQEVLAATGLADRVWPVVTPSSYTWFLYRLIQTRSDGDRCMPCFDLCYIDGAHEWAVDGFAFLLVDKRLTPGGWLLFDDLDWTYASSRTLAWAPSSLELPDDEYRTAQVGEEFDLLVRQHPNYGECHRMSRWGWARKRPGDARHA